MRAQAWSRRVLEGLVFKASILKLRWMLCAQFFLVPLWPYLGSYITPTERWRCGRPESDGREQRCSTTHGKTWFGGK